MIQNNETEIRRITFECPETPGLISIVMCVYNSGKYLERMLDSIYAQTYKKFEVIVAYDTKSTDNSLEILNRYATEKGLIIDADNDSSLGFSRVRGARLSHGEYIVFLDGDDMVLPTYLEDLILCFKEYPQINIAYCNHYSANNSNVMDVYHHSITSPNKRMLISKEKALENWGTFKKSHTKILGNTWIWLVRRAYLEKINCYLANITMGEDQVYTTQLILNSEEIGHTKKIGYIYINHNESLTHTEFQYEDKLLNLNKIYNVLDPLLTANGYETLVCNRKKAEIIAMTRSLPYETFRAELKLREIHHMKIQGDFTLKLTYLCFNISKKLYWSLFRLRSKIIER